MEKRLEFPNTDDGQAMFHRLYDGMLLGGQLLRQQDPPRDKDGPKQRVRLEAKILRRLHPISEEVPERPNRLKSSRDLKAGRQSVIFDVAELEHIDRCLQAVPWGGSDVVSVADLYDLLSSAREVIQGEEVEA